MSNSVTVATRFADLVRRRSGESPEAWFAAAAATPLAKLAVYSYAKSEFVFKNHMVSPMTKYCADPRCTEFALSKISVVSNPSFTVKVLQWAPNDIKNMVTDIVYHLISRIYITIKILIRNIMPTNSVR